MVLLAAVRAQQFGSLNRFPQTIIPLDMESGSCVVTDTVHYLLQYGGFFSSTRFRPGRPSEIRGWNTVARQTHRSLFFGSPTRRLISSSKFGHATLGGLRETLKGVAGPGCRDDLPSPGPSICSSFTNAGRSVLGCETYSSQGVAQAKVLPEYRWPRRSGRGARFSPCAPLRLLPIASLPCRPASAGNGRKPS